MGGLTTLGRGVSILAGLPAPSEDAPPAAPSLILVPLLAFDERVHRLGQGGGFYDRTFEALRRARSRQVPLVLTSDAHHERELARIRFAALNAERAAIPPDRVVNTWDSARLGSWLGG